MFSSDFCPMMLSLGLVFSPLAPAEGNIVATRKLPDASSDAVFGLELLATTICLFTEIN